MGAFLCRLGVPNAFDGKGGFDMDANHVSPQVVLATITLVGIGAGDGGARAGAECEAGISFCSVAVTDLVGTRSYPKLLGQKP